MNRTRYERYKGHIIAVYEQTKIQAFIGGQAPYKDYVLAIDDQDVSEHVMPLGTEPDDWIEQAKQLIDAFSPNGGGRNDGGQQF